MEVGDEVYIRCEFIPSTEKRVTENYPERTGVIRRIQKDVKEENISVTRENNKSWWFNESDLCPVYTYENKKYYWDGEIRRVHKGDILFCGSGQPDEWRLPQASSCEYKILKPIAEEKMKYKPLKPITPLAILEAGDTKLPKAG